MSAARHERLMNLTFVLLNSKRPITREEIKRRVPGYSDSQQAFERMFERDKEELREAGVEVVTRPIDDMFEDQLGYLITQKGSPEVSLTVSATELALLQLAQRAWRDPELRALASLGALKLEVRPDYGEVNEPAPEHHPAKVTMEITSLTAKAMPLLLALVDRKVCHFSYRKPADEVVSVRTVEPWRLFRHLGAWYLLAFDQQAEAHRVFRVSRMVSVPVVSPDDAKNPRPEGEDLDSLATFAEGGSQVGRIWIDAAAPGEITQRVSGLMSETATFEFDGRNGTAGRVNFWGAQDFAMTLLNYAPHVVVLEPAKLKEAMHKVSLQGLAQCR
jgi:proteasome accessory factor B